MINWHECCKSVKGHGPAIRKVENNGEWGQTKSTKNDDYITEGKLLQFGKKLQDYLVKIIIEKFTMEKQFSVPKREGQKFDGNKRAREQKAGSPSKLQAGGGCKQCLLYMWRGPLQVGSSGPPFQRASKFRNS